MLRSKDVWLKKIFESKKILGPTNLSQKNIVSKKIKSKKILGPQKLWVQKI